MAAATEPKRKPGWMSIPGGPKEPNFQDFKSKFDTLVSQKKKMFDELKAIKEEWDAARGDNGERAAVDKERATLREKISKIDGDRKKEREARRAADDRIKAVRNDRRAIERQLDALTEEVGAFSDVAEIEEAIELVMFKLETGAASLAAEKACIKRLSKLEEAKGLLQKLAPLEEAIADAEERELDLQQESRDIHSRIAALNTDYEKELAAKMDKDKERAKNSFDFQPLIKRREVARKQLDELNASIDELRAEFDKGKDAWNEWRVVAQEKFNAKMKEERDERERVYKEREAARKLERRRSRAAKKLNPHKMEIDACSTLIAYLQQKVKIHAREVEEAEKRKKLAAFDAAALAPKGTVLSQQGDDEWLFGDRAKKGGKKPAAKKPAAKPAATSAPAEVAKDSKKKQIHHSQDKQAQFEAVKVDAPVTYGAIDATVEALKKQKKEFESKIVINPDDVDITSSDDEEAQGEAADDETQVASTAAPTAA